MKKYLTVTPEGTRDLLFEECQTHRGIQRTLSQVFASRGFNEVITPSLEFYDVFSLEDAGLFVRDAETVGTSVNFLIREGILVARAAPEIKLHEAAEGGNVEAIKQLEAVRKRHTFERLIEQMDDDEFN